MSSSIWTENINLGLDIAPKIKAGVVWINSTNLFDASAGFGGYRESGFGREGGEEGLLDYLNESSKPKISVQKQKKNKNKKIEKTNQKLLIEPENYLLVVCKKEVIVVMINIFIHPIN